jgi:hypothetical protein
MEQGGGETQIARLYEFIKLSIILIITSKVNITVNDVNEVSK